ncbi:MAG: sugar phosphate nucleotidyltransferase [Candidatus Latescibacterota bacterium]
MKAVIPVAGMGTRLRPQTYTVPKALLHVAGKPIIGHILDKVAALGIEDVVLVVGEMGDRIVRYVKEAHCFRSVEAVEQEERKGLGHAIGLTESLVGGEPILIIYGDTIFEGDLPNGISDLVDGMIGVKQVADPARFGVVKLEGKRIVDLVEKPEQFVSDLAIVGVNYIRNTPLLFECLGELLAENIRTRGEYQLTDAFRKMVDKGAVLEVFSVAGWFDCGKPETLLATNRYLLRKESKPSAIVGSTILPPVFIAPSATIIGSIVGPYVSVAEGARVEWSIVKDSIIGAEAVVQHGLLEGSLIGNKALVRGAPQRLNVGDSSEIGMR